VATASEGRSYEQGVIDAETSGGLRAWRDFVVDTYRSRTPKAISEVNAEGRGLSGSCRGEGGDVIDGGVQCDSKGLAVAHGLGQQEAALQGS
jgi:hypothetical protein